MKIMLSSPSLHHSMWLYRFFNKKLKGLPGFIFHDIPLACSFFEVYVAVAD